MFILLSITSIFSFIFITLLVATATLDGLPPYRTVLSCFHLLWTIVLIYFELFSYILGWFYRLIIVLTFKLFIFKLRTLFSLQHYCASVSLPISSAYPSPLYGIRATLFWPVVVLLCLCFLSMSTRNFGTPLLCSLLTVVGATLVVKWIPRT